MPASHLANAPVMRYRRQIETQLLHEMHLARGRYLHVASQTATVIAQYSNLPRGHFEGYHARSMARAHEIAALRIYRDALERYSRVMLMSTRTGAELQSPRNSTSIPPAPLPSVSKPVSGDAPVTAPATATVGLSPNVRFSGG
jgi:hypothetical protein